MDDLGPTRLGFADEKDVDLFIARLEAFERGEISPDEWRAFRLVNGVYGQRQDGAMMIRAKIPGGIVTPAQLLALADVAERWAGGVGHVTTRQNVQLHFVAMENVEEALRRLAGAGITTREACGNSVRNMTLCPYAGVSTAEPFDATPYLEALARHLLRGPYSSTLPRKFKPAFSGCCGTDCALARINDLGFLQKERDGRIGFELTAGGGLATLRRSALSLEEFLPAEEILEAAEAVVRVFHRIGNRNNKAKARLKWAIDKIGPEAFRAEYRAEREVIRAEGGRPLVLPIQPPPPLPSLPQPAEPAPGFSGWAAGNVRAQKHKGYSAVTVRVPLGALTSAQMRALADVSGLGEGEVRLTPDQNVVVRWVPTWRLPLVHRALAAVGLARPGAGAIADVVSCPGSSSCKLAVTASRGLAGLLSEHLEAHPEIAARAPDLHIRISGCPNGCGQHYIGGIGFQGGVRKIDGRAVPQYLVYLGGGVASDRAFFGRLVGKVPARYVPAALDRLLDLYQARRMPHEAPELFFARVPLDEAKAVLKDLFELDAGRAVPDDFVDIGETKAFVEEVSEGECAA